MNPKNTAKPKPVIRTFLIDDEGRNKIMVKSHEKTVVVYVMLETDEGRKRKIGIITKSTRTLNIRRKKDLHLFRKGNAYGFNEYVMKNAKLFDKISLNDGEHDWKFPLNLITEKGKYLQFEQQGFEKQLFLSLDELEPYRILPKEKRRI